MTDLSCTSLSPLMPDDEHSLDTDQPYRSHTAPIHPCSPFSAHFQILKLYSAKMLSLERRIAEAVELQRASQVEAKSAADGGSGAHPTQALSAADDDESEGAFSNK